MKYSEAKQGRVFIVRLEDGEIVHEVIEQFALDHKITAASLIVVGGPTTKVLPSSAPPTTINEAAVIL